MNTVVSILKLLNRLAISKLFMIPGILSFNKQ